MKGLHWVKMNCVNPQDLLAQPIFALNSLRDFLFRHSPIINVCLTHILQVEQVYLWKEGKEGLIKEGKLSLRGNSEMSPPHSSMWGLKIYHQKIVLNYLNRFGRYCTKKGNGGRGFHTIKNGLNLRPNLSGIKSCWAQFCLAKQVKSIFI